MVRSGSADHEPDLRHCLRLRSTILELGPLPLSPNETCLDSKPYTYCHPKQRHCAKSGDWLQSRCRRMCQLCNATKQQLDWEAHHDRARLDCAKVRSPHSRCAGYFVDAGANNGDSFAMWYDVGGCWSATGVPFQTEIFSYRGEMAESAMCTPYWPDALPIELRRQYCSVVYEPNPAHYDGLLARAKQLRRRYGSNVTVLTSAFSDQNGVADFGLDTIGKDSVGSSLELSRHTVDKGGIKGRGQTLAEQGYIKKVRTVDAAEAIASLGDGRSRNVVLKIDIEGSEFTVLRHLLESGVMCRRVSHLFVEWHATSPESKGAKKWIETQLRLPCRTKLHKWM
jgi:FkbM family methyltransferase